MTIRFLQDATAQLQQVLAKDPSSGHAWHTLGQMAEETGDLEEAARCYTEGTRSSGMIQTCTHNTNTNYNYRYSRTMYI